MKNDLDINVPFINHLLDLWLEEDIGRGDLTNSILKEDLVSAYWVAKKEGVFCGGNLIQLLFKKLDPLVEIKLLLKDGDRFQADQKVLEIEGPANALIKGERTALNISMHLSGIATTTAILVEQLKDTSMHLVDTRKTTPGLRLLEKYAVRCGGGINHRLGLDDAAMLKENHIAWSDGITASIKTLRAHIPWTTKIIVEAETPNQAEEAVKAGADGVLLDEMRPEIISSLVPRLRELASFHSANNSPGSITIEISGIDPMKIKDYITTGADLISTSAPITKSNWMDFSMRFNDRV